MDHLSSPRVSEILAHCELFSSLSSADCERLAARCEVRQLSADTLIISEGDHGTEMYVLIEGVLEAFKITADEEVVLQRVDSRGAHLGEISLRPSSDGIRRASVRCLTDARVIAMPKDAFTDAAALNPAMVEHLDAVHRRQTRQISLVEQSVMYRTLVLFDQEHGWSRAEHFDSGEVIFHEGDPGASVYVVRSGSVRISREEDGEQTTLSLLHDGQTFGELAVLEGRPRGATATAETAVELVAFDREQFLDATAKIPELHDYLGALKRVYSMGEGMATLFDGEFRGEPAVVTVVRLDDGREAIVNHVIERNIYSASVEIPDGVQVEEFTYRDRNRDILRTLALLDGGLVRVHSEGPWKELGEVHSLLLKQATLEADALAEFVSSGHLLEPAALSISDPQALLCQCLRLTRRTIESTLAHGAVTLEELSRETGATTICGGCTATIAEMLGSTGQAVTLSEEIQVNPAVRSFRFVPCGLELEDESRPEPLRTALPGQHVMVSAEIDGAWVHRPYTITSPAECIRWREITVRREDHGFLSNWLFNRPPETNLKMSHPKGDFWIDPEVPGTVVCMVAGIGMTPALAIARSIAESGAGQRLHIDYSARTERDFAYRGELDAIAARNPNISIHYRCTGGRQHLESADVGEIQRRFKRARFMICGPAAYQEDVCRHLREAGVKPGKIQVEVFTPVGHAPQEYLPQRSRADRWQLIATVTLCLAYLLQQALGWSPASLVSAQQIDAYRIATGALLLAFVAYQWYLPTLRLRGKLLKASRQYRRHRYLGVLAAPLLFLHSVSLGYAYTAVLASLFVFNALFGAFDRTLINGAEARRRFQSTWLLVHVPVSCLISVLVVIHMFYALAYK